jgi:hypothetical protein
MNKFASLCVLFCATLLVSSEAFSPIGITTASSATQRHHLLDTKPLQSTPLYDPAATTGTTAATSAAPAPDVAPVEAAPLATTAAVAPTATKKESSSKTFPLNNGSVAPSFEKRPFVVGLNAVRRQQRERGIHCESFGDTSRQVNTEFTTFSGL